MPSALRLRVARAAPFSDLTGDLRLAGRLLRRQPGFAAAAIVTMALGAGITTGVVSIVEAVLVRPLPYGNGDRVYAVRESDGVRHGSSLSWADFVDLSGSLRSFSALAGFNGGSRTLTGVGAAERLPATYVTSRFFTVLGVTPALGRDFTDADGVRGAASVVILSDTAWRRRFNADPTVIGRAITLSGEASTIIGVLPRSFIFPPRADPELWMPLRPSPQQEQRPYLHFLDALGALAPGVTPAMAADELRRRTREWNTSGGAWHATTGLYAVSLRDDMVSGVRPVLYVLLGASLLVLLTAAANVAGLVLVRASGRWREVAVRSALGATRYRLARQLVTEALCLATLGSAAGLLVGAWGLATFSAVTPLRIRAGLPYATQVSLSPRAAALGALLTIAAVVAASLWPASGPPRSPRRSSPALRVTGSRADTRVPRRLVAAQTPAVVRSPARRAHRPQREQSVARLAGLRDRRPGVGPRPLLPAALREPRGDRRVPPDRLLIAARAVPGVAGAEAINQLPLTGSGNSGDFTIVGRATTPSSNPLIRDVTPGYFALMGIPLGEGRRIAESDTRAAPRVVVVNRTLARFYYPQGGALGQRIVFAFFDGRPEWTMSVSWATNSSTASIALTRVFLFA